MLSALQSPIEQKVRAATKDDGYKPSERILAEIADATHSYKHLPVIMKVIWKRLNDHTRNWKKLFKGLLVLEYIMKNGSEQVRIEVQVRRPEVQTLSIFQHGGTFDGKDIGLHVRDKAKEILEWLDANPPGSKKPAQRTASNPPPQQQKSFPSNPASPYQAQPVPMHYQSPPQPQPQFHPGPAPVALHPNAYHAQESFAPKPLPVPSQPQAHPVPQPYPTPGYGGAGPTLPPLPPKNTSPQSSISGPPADPFANPAGGFDPFATSSDDPFARAQQQQQQQQQQQYYGGGYPPQQGGYPPGHNPFASPPRP